MVVLEYTNVLELIGLPISRFYVYALCDPLTGNPFYIGKGSKKRYRDHFKEAANNKSFNKYKTNKINKILRKGNKVIVDIVFSSYASKKCYVIEKQLIKKFGRKNNKTGILTNLTDGGEGGVWRHTELHKQKLRKNNPGATATAKLIHQIEPKSGEVIRTWPSTRQAGLNLKIRSWRNISDSANNHKNRVVGGFYWRWVNDNSIFENKLIGVEQLNNNRRDKSLCAGIRIQQLSKEKNFIAEWKNMSVAARELGFNVASISRAIKTNKLYRGCYWSKVSK